MKRISESTVSSLAVQAQHLAQGVSDPAYTVTSLTTLIEVYIDSMLRALIETSGVRGHPFLVKMYQELEESIFQSWPARFQWLRDGFGISIGGTAEGQNMRTLIELRNAIVHGSGSLTDRQSRELVNLLELERNLKRVLGVNVERRRVYFTDTPANVPSLCADAL